ncbi:MAG TPA: Hsp20/alpha crystallin family protein [Planctomycetota bacterium]|nr:Hsp20/alpha crystallin family protein [Planctomycetota bacterium]
MALGTLNPTLLALSQWRAEMDRAFETLHRGTDGATPRSRWGTRTFPQLNLLEDDDRVYVEAELPGLRMEDLDVVVTGSELSIKGRRSALPEEGLTVHRRERGSGEFHRVVRLPVDVEVDRVQATLVNGVLTVALPKARVARPRRIEVKAR